MNKPEKLPALSLRQPWAEEVMRGKKKIEYRSIPTNIRGRVYLYASLGRYSKTLEAEFSDDVGYDLDPLPRGVIVGTVEIVDCIYNRKNDDYEWMLGKPKRFPKPVKPKFKAQPVWFRPFGK
ncbi:MAG: ASCH domain-containing protein [Planctomycetia bacterium]|nr:ASCH domain-containing protein [Planctomycetia bacterium]